MMQISLNIEVQMKNGVLRARQLLSQKTRWSKKKSV